MSELSPYTITGFNLIINNGTITPERILVMFDGNISGNITGTLYMLAYQILGILIAQIILKKEKSTIRLLIGSVFGTIGLCWSPILFSFFVGFTKTSHICGLIFFALITILVIYIKSSSKVSVKKTNKKKHAEPKQHDSIKNYPFLIVGIPLFIFFCMMLSNHTLVTSDSGAFTTGQCGFGDMNMHFSFITSIANQHSFPPYYSLLPDTKLSYPFLSDTISSSIYIWGASLRYAYMLPMWIAILQVMFGMYSFAESWLKSKWKAFLAFVLFFFNGGFGIIYFLNGKYTFSELMNGFYITPTNLIDVNIRWTNTIVDMLLPQRATLFGWALLFPALYLLRRAWNENRKDFFIIVGVIAGALPMIHTHSFLALGIISLGWLIADMGKTTKFFSLDNDVKNIKKQRIILASIILFAFIFFSVISAIQNSAVKEINSKIYLAIGVIGIIILLCLAAYIFFTISKENRMNIIKTWGLFLGIVIIFAAPQLLYWTFGQVAGGDMLKGHFNWSNTGDIAEPYLLFYLKNIGLTAILFIPAWIFSKRKDIAHVFPAMIIWFICELIVFQPNVYDNNKLLLAAYMLICCFVAGALCDWLKLLFNKNNTVGNRIVKYAATAVLIVLFTISGFLTMIREYYSGTKNVCYELYSGELLDVCRYIEKNTPANAVILTANNHNNAVASLTGRNIVCGSGTFLYYHGLNYSEREAALSQMYENVEASNNLYKLYNVSYILVGPDELNTFPNLDEQTIYSKYTCEYSTNQVRLYRVK